MTQWLRDLVPRSRRRAVRSGFVHDLPADQGQRLFRKQQGVCAMSGLPFSLAEFAGVLVKHPFAPSLDRISSRAGYVTDNVRLVCVAVNFGMGQWGEELYLTFARAAVALADRPVRTLSDHAIQAEVLNAGAIGVDADASWMSEQRERIAAAETIALTLSGPALMQQQRRIAGLKRALTLGPGGLSSAAAKAAQTRNGTPSSGSMY